MTPERGSVEMLQSRIQRRSTMPRRRSDRRESKTRCETRDGQQESADDGDGEVRFA